MNFHSFKRHCVLLSVYTLTFVTHACNKPASPSGSSRTTPPPSTTTTTTKEDTTLASLSFQPLSTTSVYTSEAGTNNCVSFAVKGLTDKNTPAKGASINISLLGVATEELKDWGILSSPVTVGDNGLAEGTFCAAMKTGKRTLIAESGKLKANSGEITISTKPFYTFEYRNSDFDYTSDKPKEVLKLNLLDSGPNDCGNVFFQLKKLDNPVAGVTIKFKSDFSYPAGTKFRPKASNEISYETDPTNNQKFLSYTATSDTDGLFKIPLCAGQLPGAVIVYADYTDEYGKFSQAKSPPISISSGVANLSTIALSFDETNARTLKALFNNETPKPIDFSIKLGSVFGGSLSQANQVYVYSESGSFPSGNVGVPDSSGSVKFSMLATYNGSARPTPVHLFEDSSAQSTCDPEAIAIELNARPAITADKLVKDSYYKIVDPGNTAFTSIGASSNAVATVFKATGPGTGTGTAKLASFSYAELAKNWRSTLTYTTRGQETFNDANRNGKYDTGGDGFWDKNHDGTYTKGVDAVTVFGSVAAGCRCLKSDGTPNNTAPTTGIQSKPCTESLTSPSCFRPNSEWFIDLPTPFVDANENGIFDPFVDANLNGVYEPDIDVQNMDRLIGDVYSEPNGKRDLDTVIWKSLVLPIYTGTSPYSLVRSHIKIDSKLTPSGSPDSETETKPVLDYFKNLADRNLNTFRKDYIDYLEHAEEPLNDSNMIGNGPNGYFGYRWFTAKGICGTPLPGGTKIEATEELVEEVYGDRGVAIHFYQQPGDGKLDPSRRLLLQSGGENTAEINFNIPDHPSASLGYPIEYSIEVPPCTRAVEGGVGVWCARMIRDIFLKVDTDRINTRITIPEYDAVTCNTPKIKNKASGTCDDPPS